MFSVSISLGNLFTAPLLPPLSLLSSSTLESILPPAHCNAAAVIAPNRLLWLEEPREGRKEGKQDEKLISGRLKPATSPPLRSLRHKVGALRLAPIKVDYGNCRCLPCSQNAPRQLIFLTGNEPLLLWFNPNGLSAGQNGAARSYLCAQRRAPISFGADLHPQPPPPPLPGGSEEIVM